MSRLKKKIKKPIWLNWSGRGYFTVPHEPLIPFPREFRAQPTRAWVSAFQHARNGNFRYVDLVPNLLGVESDFVPYQTCSDLLGDAVVLPQKFGHLVLCGLTRG
ncbi:hypothetical protein ENSA5_09810 [Enhygromyxa salina]|uniref:Uncharacterized protein n=1 Tax=Enhygromyxa salina TaxID=215803 RepID=A0A2S9YGG3_9BACT|nr:hypothetical protein ENSA5_09810 [Enhygromyxa salina]